MRKLFYLFMVAMCATMFTACSDDDDKNDGVTNKEGKKLVSRIIYSENGSSSSSMNEFIYDSDGNILKIIETYGRYADTTLIERNGNKITRTYIDGSYKEYTWYTLDNKGRIIKEEDEDNDMTIFTYDDLGQLIKAESEDDCSYQYTWEKNNLVLKKHYHIYDGEASDSNIEAVYEYTDKKNNINIDFTWESYGAYGLESYFGSTNKNLMKSYTEDGTKYEYEYEFDGDYVSTIREYRISSYDNERRLENTYHIYYKE